MRHHPTFLDGRFNNCLLVVLWQYWMLSKAGEIRRDEACLDYSGGDVVLYPCHGSKGNQVYAMLNKLHNDCPNTHVFFGLSNSCGCTMWRPISCGTAHRTNAWPSTMPRRRSSWRTAIAPKSHSAGAWRTTMPASIRGLCWINKQTETIWPEIDKHWKHGRKTAASHARSFHTHTEDKKNN